jgi:hypothetical protein
MEGRDEGGTDDDDDGGRAAGQTDPIEDLGELPAVCDLDHLGGGAAAGAHLLDGLDDVHALDDLSEDNVLAVEPRGGHGADEELGAVGVGAGVGHGEHPGARVLADELLVGELLAVDGLAAGAVAVGEVAALAHEVGDDAVEGGALVVERLAPPAHALLARAEGAEVLGGAGDLVGVQLHHDAAGRGAADGHVEEHAGVRHRDREIRSLGFWDFLGVGRFSARLGMDGWIWGGAT